MKELNVTSFVYYLTEVVDIQWRSEDYDANKIVKFIKGDDFNGRLEVIDAKNKRHVFKKEDRKEFLDLFFREIKDLIRKIIPKNSCVVPIPNSRACININEEFETQRLLEQMVKAAEVDCKVVPALRWAVAHEPFRVSKRHRDPDEIFENLRIVSALEGQVILFDDVFTSGAHLKAATWRLSDNGVEPSFAFVVGRTTKEQHANMLGIVNTPLQVERAQIRLVF